MIILKVVLRNTIGFIIYVGLVDVFVTCNCCLSNALHSSALDRLCVRLNMYLVVYTTLRNRKYLSLFY